MRSRGTQAHGPAYLFGCGNCHPVAPRAHVDGQPEVALDPLAAASSTLRGENADAAAYAAGRCDGVYCHSSGQARAARTYTTSPDWYAGTGTLGCAGCHGNPPRYGNAGPGPGANGHLAGWDWWGVMNLVNAQWNPATKSCSSVACHLKKQTWEWGAAATTCENCHGGQ